jgi:hypothetical protein
MPSQASVGYPLLQADAAGRFASAVRGPAKWPIAELDRAHAEV